MNILACRPLARRHRLLLIGARLAYGAFPPAWLARFWAGGVRVRLPLSGSCGGHGTRRAIRPRPVGARPTGGRAVGATPPFFFGWRTVLRVMHFMVSPWCGCPRFAHEMHAPNARRVHSFCGGSCRPHPPLPAAVGGSAPVEPPVAERARRRGVFHGIVWRDAPFPPLIRVAPLRGINHDTPCHESPACGRRCPKRGSRPVKQN